MRTGKKPHKLDWVTHVYNSLKLYKDPDVWLTAPSSAQPPILPCGLPGSSHISALHCILHWAVLSFENLDTFSTKPALSFYSDPFLHLPRMQHITPSLPVLHYILTSKHSLTIYVAQVCRLSEGKDTAYFFVKGLPHVSMLQKGQEN